MSGMMRFIGGCNGGQNVGQQQKYGTFNPNDILIIMVVSRANNMFQELHQISLNQGILKFKQ